MTPMVDTTLQVTLGMASTLGLVKHNGWAIMETFIQRSNAKASIFSFVVPCVVML